jgi:hypothetical protein
MKVYLIYKDDAWHTKGSGELLRVADNLQKMLRNSRGKRSFGRAT